MDENGESDGRLGVAKLLQAAFLASIGIYVTVLLRLSSLDVVPPLANDPLLNIIAWALGYAAAVSLGFWCYWPRLLLRAYKLNRQRWNRPPDALFVHVIRICFLQSVAIYGLVLGVLGAEYKITLPFFAVAAIMLALTFPNKKKW